MILPLDLCEVDKNYFILVYHETQPKDLILKFNLCPFSEKSLLT